MGKDPDDYIKHPSRTLKDWYLKGNFYVKGEHTVEGEFDGRIIMIQPADGWKFGNVFLRRYKKGKRHGAFCDIYSDGSRDIGVNKNNIKEGKYQTIDPTGVSTTYSTYSSIFDDEPELPKEQQEK